MRGRFLFIIYFIIYYRLLFYEDSMHTYMYVCVCTSFYMVYIIIQRMHGYGNSNLTFFSLKNWSQNVNISRFLVEVLLGAAIPYNTTKGIQNTFLGKCEFSKPQFGKITKFQHYISENIHGLGGGVCVMKRKPKLGNIVYVWGQLCFICIWPLRAHSVTGWYRSRACMWGQPPPSPAFPSQALTW